MSTRAMYTFADEYGSFNVYKHHDGYPSGAADAIRKAIEHSWALPRFEADDFAAGFVAGNKPSFEQHTDYLRKSFNEPDYMPMRSMHGGGIRLMHSGDWKDVAPCDLAYRYHIRVKGPNLWVRAFSVNSGYGENAVWTEQQLFHGTLENFAKWTETDKAA